MVRRTLGLIAIVVAILSGGVEVTSAQAPAQAQKAAATAPASVNLNTATVAQLDTLPGVGPRLAERIIEYRQKNGGFKKIEDLMNVQGIGEKNFLKLKPLVTVTPPKTEQ